MKIEEYEIRKINDFLTLEDLKDKLASNNLILIKAYTDKLLEENRIEDCKRIAKDPEFCQHLMEEFGIE